MWGAIASAAVSAFTGGGGSGGGFLGKLGGVFSGGLSGILDTFLGGGKGKASGNDAKETLGDIKDLLTEVLHRLDEKGGSDGGKSGCGRSSGHEKPGREEQSCCNKPEPKPRPDEDCGCDGSGGADNDEADGPEWDGRNKSPSLDRERGAARLLEQAKATDDPKEKRELIDMALDMLGEGKKRRADGNSYDKDIAKKAEEMMERIDDSCLSDCGKSNAMDGVIDMLMEEGGVDGKAASRDTNGNGRADPGDYGCWRPGYGNPMPMFHNYHLHHGRNDH